MIPAKDPDGRQVVTMSPLVDSETVSVVRLVGPARDPVNGRHREMVVLVRCDTTVPATIKLLDEAAAALRETIPRRGRPKK